MKNRRCSDVRLTRAIRIPLLQFMYIDHSTECQKVQIWRCYAHSTMETKVEAMNCIEKYL